MIVANSRRRWQSLAVIAAGVIALAVLAVALRGFERDSMRAAHEGLKSPAQITPSIDREAGVSLKASQEYLPSIYDVMRLDATIRLAEIECFRAHGVTGPLDVPRVVDPLYRSRVAFPPFTVKQAEEYAFHEPQPVWDLFANGVMGATDYPELSEKWDARRAESRARYRRAKTTTASDEYMSSKRVCDSAPQVVGWDARRVLLEQMASGPWYREFLEDESQAFADPKMAGIEDIFDACVKANGVEPVLAPETDSEDIFLVEGARYDVIDDEQIRLAVVVAKCKMQHRISSRVLEVVAEYESETFRNYERELLNNRASLEKLRADMDEFWSSHARKG